MRSSAAAAASSLRSAAPRSCIPPDCLLTGWYSRVGMVPRVCSNNGIDATSAIFYDDGSTGFDNCDGLGPDLTTHTPPPYTLAKVADGLVFTYHKPVDSPADQFKFTVRLQCNKNAGTGTPGRVTTDLRRSEYSVTWPTDAACASVEHICTTT